MDFENRRERAERLAVDVIDDGGSEKQRANRPADSRPALLRVGQRHSSPAGHGSTVSQAIVIGEDHATGTRRNVLEMV